METTVQARRRPHSGGLIPLSESAFRHRRLYHGISMLRIAARANVSLRKISLAERGELVLDDESKSRMDRALDQLIAESARSAAKS